MSAAEALRALLDEAYAAMRDGEAAEAERRARAVSALIRAEKELAELAAAQEQEPEDNADARAHHRETRDVEEIAVDDRSAASIAAPFAQRGDHQETAVEARVRFLDAARDYLIAGVSARRMDAAEGGVASMPLVLEPEAAEALAQRVLADQRARVETLRLELGPHQQALEPGDRIQLAGRADIFEIERIEETEVLSLEVRRARNESAAHLGLADPNAPAPQLAPTPAVSILDLPPLPSVEDDDRPLAAVLPHRGSARTTSTQAAALRSAVRPRKRRFWANSYGRCGRGRLIAGTKAMSRASNFMAAYFPARRRRKC